MDEKVAKTPRPHMLDADEVAELLRIKKGSAYEVIRKINACLLYTSEPQGAARAQSRDGDRTVGREARAARKRQDRRRRIRGLESLAVAALRISRSTQPNQDGGPGGERRSGLRKLSFYSPLHAKAFPAHLGSK